MALVLSGDAGITFPVTAGSASAVQASSGRVLQVVNATYSTAVLNTTSTLADTNLTATITPSSATSKILVLISQYIYIVSGINSASANTGLIDTQRNGTSIFQTDNILGIKAQAPSGDVNQIFWYLPIFYLDSPATTSATTYKTQMALSTTGGTNKITAQYNNKPSTITLMEIAA